MDIPPKEPLPPISPLASAAAQAVEQGADLAWSSPADLGRQSFEAFVAQRSLGRVISSRGQLRIHGAGVGEHSIRIADLGGVLTSFQRTVSAVGGALSGINSSRGSLPVTLVQRTHLRLNASPAPGSVILTMVPEQAPSAELYPTGAVPLADDERPLADRSLEEVIDLLTVGGGSAATASAAVRRGLATLGPRAASAIRAFLRIVADDELDFDLSWTEPDRPARRTTVTASQARFIETIIGNNALDVDEIVIEGIVRTVSDLRPLDVDVDGQIWRLQLGDQPPPNLSEIGWGDRVQATVSAATEQRAGGDEITTYTLVTIRRLGAEDA